MATLAQALSILGFLAPLIIFLIKRQSRFVSFHALQALLWHITYLVLVMVVMMVFVAVFAFTIMSQVTNAHGGAGPPGAFPAVFLIFPFIWLVFAAAGICNLVLAVVYAVKAGQGEWANYPVFGKWARKLLKMAPA